METKIVDGLLIVKLNLIQTVAVAFIVYFMGLRIRQQVPIFARFSIPAPVIGGLFFATVATLLRSEGIVGFEFDETMQYTLMIMFFTTIGMGASILLVKRGGLPLLIYFGLAGILAIFQNVVGIVMAKIIGIHPLLGIVAGAISLMGGLGTGGAFGPLFESWGVAGATSAAFACATFGMVIGSLIGGPLAKP